MKNISIVLVEPISSGNIGSTARAMKNTGFRRLVLVNPADPANNDALSMACNAGDTLRKAKIFSTLEEAIKDQSYIVGTTRRKGRDRYPLLSLPEAAPEIYRLAQKNKIAVLFGREDDGLSTEELSRCNLFVEIPTHEEYASLNLSQAVLLFCYELFKLNFPVEKTIELAPPEDFRAMYTHLEKVIRKLGYGEKGGEKLPRAIMRSLKRLFGRTGLMPHEVNMIRGLCSQIENRIKSEP